jgi:hypothetical protein
LALLGGLGRRKGGPSSVACIMCLPLTPAFLRESFPNRTVIITKVQRSPFPVLISICFSVDILQTGESADSGCPVYLRNVKGFNAKMVIHTRITCLPPFLLCLCLCLSAPLKLRIHPSYRNRADFSSFYFSFLMIKWEAPCS